METGTWAYLFFFIMSVFDFFSVDIIYAHNNYEQLILS